MRISAQRPVFRPASSSECRSRLPEKGPSCLRQSDSPLRSRIHEAMMPQACRARYQQERTKWLRFSQPIWTDLDRWTSDQNIGAWESYERRRAAQEILQYGDRLASGGVHCRGGLELVAFRDLQDLPEGLLVEGAMELYAFDKLQRLPSCLDVGTDLLLHNCPSLRMIPATIRVGGVIDIRGCSPDLTIPPGFRVRMDGKILS